MFGFGSKGNAVLCGVIFDIGSESIGISIVESDHTNEFPNIIFSHRVPMRITKNELTGAERMRHMREALFSASLIISRDGLEALSLHNRHARIKHILVVVSAPWSKTISRSVNYTGETELKITRTLIDELVGSAESEISNHLTDLVSSDEKSGYTIIERATIDVRINDYAIKHPIGLRGNEISLVHVSGLIPNEIITAVEEVEEKIFPNTTIRSHTFLLVLHCVLREIFKEQSAITIVHVTGETTEFGIVENETLIESISIPCGLNTIVRSLMTHKEQTAKEIYSMLELFHANNLTPEQAQEIEGSLNEYTQKLKDELKKHSDTRRFPKQAFVLAPSSFTELFRTILNPVLKEGLGIASGTLIFTQDILGATATHDEADLSTMITSRFFHKLHGCGEIDSV